MPTLPRFHRPKPVQGRRRAVSRARAASMPVHPDPDQWIAKVIAEPKAEPAAPAGPVATGPRSTPSRWRRRGQIVGFAAAATVVVLLAAASWSALSGRSVAREDLARLEGRLDAMNERVRSLTEQRTSLQEQLSTAQSQADELRSQLATANAQLDDLRNAQQETTAPNDSGITVETTGYETLISIRGVHLTHGNGFSDLVGIAVNRSGHDIKYAEIGCSFLDSGGLVLANVIDNHEDWPAGASWGFDCGAEVDATGGIVRVNSVT